MADLFGFIGAERIHHQYLVGKLDAFQTIGNFFFFVKGYDNSGKGKHEGFPVGEQQEIGPLIWRPVLNCRPMGWLRRST